MPLFPLCVRAEARTHLETVTETNENKTSVAIQGRLIQVYQLMLVTVKVYLIADLPQNGT